MVVIFDTYPCCYGCRRWPAFTQSRSPSASWQSASSSSCWRTTFDPAGLSERVEALEKQMGEPGFWDDQERAAQVGAEHARASKRLALYRDLERDVEDLEPLAELAEEDPEIARELEEQIRSVTERLEQLEEQRLFSGR